MPEDRNRRQPDPDRLLDDWLALPWAVHLGAVGAIVLAICARWWWLIFTWVQHIDEKTYLEAFQLVAAGRSPYAAGGYHYPPAFAQIGAWILELLGAPGTLVAMRVASLAGVAFVVWCATAWLRLSWRGGLAVALLYVAAAPAIGEGFGTGNISFAVVGVVTAALVGWWRRPLLSGLGLGATIAAKPIAPLALVSLLFHRPPSLAKRGDGAVQGPAGKPNRGSQQHRLAGAVGIATAALMLIPGLSRLAEMSAQPIHYLAYNRSYSLHRLLNLLGLEIRPVWLMLAGAVLVALLLQLRTLSRTQLLCTATAASVFVTPMIWTHTLILLLPLQAVALAWALQRRRRLGQRGLYELIFVILASLALQLATGAGAVDDRGRLVQLIVLSVPYLAPLFLLLYPMLAPPIETARTPERATPPPS